MASLERVATILQDKLVPWTILWQLLDWMCPCASCLPTVWRQCLKILTAVCACVPPASSKDVLRPVAMSWVNSENFIATRRVDTSAYANSRRTRSLVPIVAPEAGAVSYSHRRSGTAVKDKTCPGLSVWHLEPKMASSIEGTRNYRRV